MNDQRPDEPPYLDSRIDAAKIFVLTALFLLLLGGALIWPA